MRYILIILICIYSLSAASQELGNYAVIVNRSNTAEISRHEVAKLYLGKSKKFPDGQAAIAVNLPTETKTKEKFDELVLGKTSSQVNSYWSQLVFTGRAVPLKVMENEFHVIEFVSQNPHAIGYVKLENAIESVKILFTF